jgi:hypothetical protein
MTKRTLLGVAVISLGALPIACGGESGGAGGSGGTAGTGGSGPVDPSTYEGFLAARIQRWCEQVMTCPIPNDDQLGARAVLQTTARCEQFYGEIVARSQSYSDLEAAVASGRTRFHADRAATCLASAAGCTEYAFSETGACATVLEGTFAIGQACNTQYDCVPGSYCAADDYSCPGTCAAQKAPGSPCEFDYECDTSAGPAVCDWLLDVPVCVTRPQQAGAVVGEACGVLPSGTRMACADGLWCDGASGICQTPIPIGTACTDIDAPCAGLAFCIDDGTTEMCRNVSVNRAGQPCDGQSGLPTRVCDPLASLLCVNGLCEVAGNGSEGSRCVPGDMGELSCQRGLYCDSNLDPAVCVRLQPAGTACSGSPQCAGSCDYVTHTCVDRYCGL